MDITIRRRTKGCRRAVEGPVGVRVGGRGGGGWEGDVWGRSEDVGGGGRVRRGKKERMKE